jgi:hypothetical protein
VIGLLEANEALTEILGLACVGAGAGSGSWVAVRAAGNEVDGGYSGTSATLRDQALKLKAKWSDKSTDAASEEILHLDVTAGAGTVAGAKAKLTAKAARYAINPDDIGDFVGTSGKLKVSDKTNNEKLKIKANIAVKDTEGGCFISFDETGTPISARLDGVKLNGRAIQLRTRR